MSFFYSIVKRINIIILVMSIVALGVTVSFVYTNVYRSIIQAEKVVILSGQVSDSTFNEKLWNDVVSKIDTKKESHDINELIYDPFSF